MKMRIKWISFKNVFLTSNIRSFTRRGFENLCIGKWVFYFILYIIINFDGVRYMNIKFEIEEFLEENIKRLVLVWVNFRMGLIIIDNKSKSR